MINNNNNNNMINNENNDNNNNDNKKTKDGKPEQEGDGGKYMNNPISGKNSDDLANARGKLLPAIDAYGRRESNKHIIFLKIY